MAQIFNSPASFRRRCKNIVKTLDSYITISSPVALLSSPNNAEQKQYIAIWDTGAYRTVISERVCNLRGVTPTSSGCACVFSGCTVLPMCYVDVILPNGKPLNNLKVFIAGLVDGVDVIVGMDIINQSDFLVINQNNRTNFYFRTPSLGFEESTINFIQEDR